MKTKFYLGAITLAALMQASCSDDASTLPESPLDAGAISFEVTLDRDLNSRAGESADELPSRCLMEVYDNVTNTIVGSQYKASGATTFTFTVADLQKSKEYMFVFWADGGENAYNASSLKSVAAVADNRIAFTGKVKAQPGQANVSVVLRHAVAKLSVVHDGATLKAGDVVTASFTREKYSFDALAGAYTSVGSGKETLTKTLDADMSTGEVITRYMFAPNDEMKAASNPSMLVADFKLAYKPTGESTPHEKAIPNVTFKANHRTLITGNIRNMSLGGQTFSVSLNTDWTILTPESGGGEDPGPVTPPEVPDEPETPGNNVITLTSAGFLTESMVASAVGSGNELSIKGPMAESDFNALRTYLAPGGAGSSKSLSLDLSGASFTVLPPKAFCVGEKIGWSTGEVSKPIVSLSSVVLPDGLTEIQNEAFADCTNLTSVTVPSSVTTIGECAFYKSGIVELNAIGVTTFGAYACKSCPNLTSAALGNVTSLGNYSFLECPKLSSLDLSRCTMIVEASGLLSGASIAEVTTTVYVDNEDLLTSFQQKWGDRYKVVWAIK